MKLDANLLSLATLAAFPSMLVNAGPANTCDDQSSCIQFSVNKLDTDACSVGGECTVEVCMYVSGGLSGCGKGAGKTFSHMCMQGNANGCAEWSDAAQTIPQMGKDSGTSCTATGEGSGVAAFGGKCETGSDVLMCQEGKPGQTLHWILKDGNDEGGEDKTYTMPYYLEGAAGCSSTSVKCFNNVYNCGNSDAQKAKERTWSFTIPEADGGSCDPCGSSPTTPATDPPATDPPATTPTPINPSPTDPPATNVPADNTTPTPGSNGDPHFKTWKNEHFEYHGQCDLVLTKDANFADGLGLDIQLRTKLVRYWSYIRNAAVRIGHDIIELEGSDDLQDQSVRYWYNMQFRSDEAKTLGGFPMTILRSHSKLTKIEIDLNSKYPGVKIVMSTYKEFVKVEVQGATEEAFGNSVGLLGDFKTGKTLARDGKKYIHDFREYGSEWQVTPMEDMLFHSTEEPQFPKKCLEPEDPRGERRRRLDESDITLEQAEKACARLTDPLDRKDCVYDILATQDIDMVGAF